MPVKTHNNTARRPVENQAVFRGGLGVATLTGNITLDKFSAQWLKLDPGGAARDVTLPPVEDGLFFDITNSADAAENLVVKTPAGVTVATINQNEGGIFWSDGAAWYLFRIFTVALS